MKKYAPRKVFILENGEYIEITNVEHESRLDNDPAYANRFFIPVQGFLLEVDQEHYEDFYRTKDRLTYLNRLDIKYGLLSIDAFDTEDDNGTDYISDDTEDVADTVARLLLVDKLRLVISMLSSEEQELIQALFFRGLSERKWSNECGIPQKTINDRKQRILAKLKKMLEN